MRNPVMREPHAVVGPGGSGVLIRVGDRWVEIPDWWRKP